MTRGRGSGTDTARQQTEAAHGTRYIEASRGDALGLGAKLDQALTGVTSSSTALGTPSSRPPRPPDELLITRRKLAMPESLVSLDKSSASY